MQSCPENGEKTGWDFELLDWELEDLDWEGYDFGFKVEELDVEGLFEETEHKEKEPKTMVCPHCGEVITLE